MQTHIDHLIVAARTLDQGVQWCEATLGVTPGPGGAHPQYGTHNRLIKIATPRNPMAYLEIIAVDPGAVPTARGPRWFDLDDAALQAAIGKEPQLIHFVVAPPDIRAALAALQAQGLDRGPPLAASRPGADGLLQWQISVRDDGQRLFNGALPTLIQWGAPGDKEPLRRHPRNSLPRSKVSLERIAVTHPEADALKAAYSELGLTGIDITAGAADLAATLHTPKGVVTLHSRGV
ncbi:VOC family protein [Pseudorhodoferax sp. Leaf267]|uniref:VOC family protein n=1 Tax=Pseudorhodoferax sp. Leaf267 TaxID=1736316 RepID=UPI0006F25BE4|nr:VOC family protein [Pseudorhodoferax sp. Leaf267]KQP22734.1 hypothetical protein ASF43_02175 [Pseudorhodoferax sp. Leaf267]